MGDGLWLGQTADGDRLELPASALLRHVMALGSSGSGKTVFCKVLVEEAARRGLPAICVDPQGDLCSLAAGTLSDEELIERGVDPTIAAELRDRLEVIVFTPGSGRGVPLCADPVDPGLGELDGAERTAAITRTAAVVVGLLGFDLDSDDGAGLAAVLDRVLHEVLDRTRDAEARPSLAALTDALFAAQDEGFVRFERLLDARKLRTACQRLARLDVGARRLMFHDGVPLDVDVLLGRGGSAPVEGGRTRVAVVYLNTLHQQEDKDFFVAALVDRLYGWMLAHPSEAPQALFYIDEVAPFIPPVRKPSCKEGLSSLFKQARKYGVCCVMATQNPGDVDYRAMAQFGTWALGRLTTRQDIKKIEPTVKALAPDDSDAIVGRLPSLEPGRMVLLSPDSFQRPVDLRTRWLATRHETWSEDRIATYSDAVRERFVRRNEADSERPERGEGSANEARPPQPTVADAVATPATEDPPKPLEHEESIPAQSLPGARDRAPSAAVAAALSSRPSVSARELAEAIGKSEAAARRALNRLVDAGEARVFEEGRTKRYWTPSSGGRPDLGMPSEVDVLVAHLDRNGAEAVACDHARTRVLGMIGEDEQFERADLLHRLVYQLDFEERVERPLLGRLFGGSHDERLGSVYLHPHNLGVLVFTQSDGIRFEDVPSGPASEIRDFDGVTERERRPPGVLSIEDDDWCRRRPLADVTASFEARFSATPKEIAALFVPLFQLLFRSEKGSLRRVTIDALVGKPVRWLPPS